MATRLVTKIAESIETETKQFLTCKTCGLSYNVTGLTPEAIAKEGWTLQRPKRNYASVLVCGRCTAYFQANS
jgi:hypothetical protein